MTDETRQEIARQLSRELASRTLIPPRREGQGFKSFGEFKRTIGSAGTETAWHHIVGQTTSNVRGLAINLMKNNKTLELELL